METGVAAKMQMATIDGLPTEMLAEIFCHLYGAPKGHA